MEPSERARPKFCWIVQLSRKPKTSFGSVWNKGSVGYDTNV